MQNVQCWGSSRTGLKTTELQVTYNNKVLENIWHKVIEVISKFSDVRYDQFVYCLNDVLYPIIWPV